MSKFLIDTNIISEGSKSRPQAQVSIFFKSHPVSSMYISTLSLAELQHGTVMVADDARREELKIWIASEVRPLFNDRVYEVTERILLRWIELTRLGRKANRTFAQPDLLLAATALEHNLTLVTRNTRDFTGIPGLQLLNPWEPTV